MSVSSISELPSLGWACHWPTDFYCTVIESTSKEEGERSLLAIFCPSFFTFRTACAKTNVKRPKRKKL